MKNKNPLALAFLGDAVWTRLVRERLVLSSSMKVGELHIQQNKYVSATAQARIFDKIQNNLDDDESSVALRARNAHNNTVPKSCTLNEYKKATAFEAVIGYNHLIGNTERINQFADAVFMEEK